MKRVRVDQDIAPTDHLTGQLPDDWDVTVGLAATEARLRDQLAGVEVVFVTSRVPLSRPVIEAAGDLAVIAKLGTGIDNVALDAARERGIPVTHTPGHNALSVAEHALCLLLATARRLTEVRGLVERGRWRDEAPLGTRLSGGTVGIVGIGNVGKRLGKLLSGFDVEVLVTDPYVPDIDAELVDGTMTDLGDLLERSDAVCLTPQLTEETRGLVGAEELARMQPSALLVNVSRGPVVDESALVKALRGGEIAGAGLDVFATEPLPADSPLLALDSVVLTPHVAAMTTRSREEGIDRLVGNVRALLAGEPIADRYLATTA